MRKLILITISILGLYSCSDDTTFETQSSNISAMKANNQIMALYDSIANLDSTEDQILIVSALSPNEKMQIWQAKLNTFKANTSLTSAQKGFVDRLKLLLSDDQVFVENSTARKKTLALGNGYMNEARTLFGENEGWYLLTKVENIHHRTSKLPRDLQNANPQEPLRGCNCEKNSECVRMTGISIWGISWEYGTCTRGGCYVKSYFGIWDSDNVGTCNY